MALACVCFFWGTTYLAIRIGVQSISPSTLMCARYLASGLFLVIGARVKGAVFPGAREMRRTALYGLITIGLGTGSLAFAEQWVPSGLASLFVSTQPFWLVGVEAIGVAEVVRERLRGWAVAGMLVGLIGVAYLVAPGVAQEATLGRRDMLNAFLLLQFGGVMWSIGSIAQRRLTTRAHPFVSGGVQQLATGLVFYVISALDGRPSNWTPGAIAAVAYLAVFGGVVGYSSYIFAMDRLPVAIVSVYTYINPIVAVVLGWMFYREPLGWREVIAMLVIFVGVAMVKGISGTARGQGAGARGQL
ncbi:MAG TPA: EamA family transporter [Bryobacteraceae bacterium]|nr:EamA family transporter [Bryobacteraceae bacterium]